MFMTVVIASAILAAVHKLPLDLVALYICAFMAGYMLTNIVLAQAALTL